MAAVIRGAVRREPTISPHRHRRLRFLVASMTAGFIVAALLAPIFGGSGLLARGVTSIFTELPTKLAVPPAPERSRVLASDGSTLAVFYEQNRVEVPLAKVAPVMRDALLAVEDARFYDHGPIDPQAVLRALFANLRSGGVTQGGSTLTQQYVKNLLVLAANGDPEEIRKATEPTIRRKLQEMRYAIWVEDHLTKDQILENYLNVAYFGGGAYGIEAAAHRFFSKSSDQLELAEAALLAGLVQEPGTYDPLDDPQAATGRRNIVLDRMASVGFITPAEAHQAKATELGLDPARARNGCDESNYPFFCDYVLNLVRHNPALGKTPEERVARLQRGGLTIKTTMDTRVQKAAQRAIRRHIEDTNPVATALAVVEPGTGAVRAIAVNRKFGEGKGRTQVNYAVDRGDGGSGGFQAGSAFKPFVLAAALDQGIKPSLRLPAPKNITVSGFRNCQNGKSFPAYPVENYESKSYGRLDMRQATWRSVNTYFVQLERRTGVCKPPALAEKMGLKRADGRPLHRFPSFVLGPEEVSPLRMAEAYATFATGGVHCSSRAVTQIVGRDGKPIASPRRDCQRVLDKKVADGVTQILTGVIDGRDDERTGARMSIDRPAAGKTGTTSNNVAVWFAGYTRQLAAAVWAGYPQASKPLTDVRINGQFYDRLFGSRLPGPIWQATMEAAHRDLPKRGF